MKHRKFLRNPIVLITLSIFLLALSAVSFYTISTHSVKKTQTAKSEQTLTSKKVISSTETTKSTVETPQTSEETTQTTEQAPTPADMPLVVPAEASQEATKPKRDYATSYGSFGQQDGVSIDLGENITPNTLYILTDAVQYENGGQAQGQAIINENPDGIVSTWGGASVFSGTDGLNTHFIGHNAGAFYILYDLAIGTTFTITDADMNAFTYQVTSVSIVNHTGVDVQTGEDLWEQIVGTQGGERVVLQTCDGDTEDYIIFASAV